MMPVVNESAYCSTMELNLSPSPVNVTTPTINPAAAQVAPTLSMPTEPDSSALTSPEFANNFMRRTGAPSAVRPLKNSRGIKAQSTCKKLTRNAAMVAQNTDTAGENPNTIKTTMPINDMK